MDATEATFNGFFFCVILIFIFWLGRLYARRTDNIAVVRGWFEHNGILYEVVPSTGLSKPSKQQRAYFENLALLHAAVEQGLSMGMNIDWKEGTDSHSISITIGRKTLKYAGTILECHAYLRGIIEFMK